MKKIFLPALFIFSMKVTGDVIIFVNAPEKGEIFERSLEKELSEGLNAEGVKSLVPYDYLLQLREKLLSALARGEEIRELLIPYGEYIALCSLRSERGKFSGTVRILSITRGTVEGTETFESPESELSGVLKSRIIEMLRKIPPKEGALISEGEMGWEKVSVIVSGEGKGPEAQARRIAIASALRNAVERSAGISLNVRKMKDMRKLSTGSQSENISYSLLEEEYKDGIYRVKISADIYVKKEGEGEFEMPEGLTSITLELKGKGKIDWGKGYVEAEGLGKITEGRNAEALADRAAYANALANALEIVKGIYVNEEEKVEGVIKRAGEKGYEIMGVIRNAEVVEREKIEGGIKVRVRIPLSSLRNVIRLSNTVEGAIPGIGERKKIIVVDARGKKIKPVLFPKVSSEKKEIGSIPSQVRYVKAVKKKINFDFRIMEAKGAPSQIVLTEKDAEKLKKELKEGAELIILTDEVVGGSEG